MQETFLPTGRQSSKPSHPQTTVMLLVTRQCQLTTCMYRQQYLDSSKLPRITEKLTIPALCVDICCIGDSSQQPVPKTVPNSQFRRRLPTASSTDGSQQPAPQMVPNSQLHRWFPTASSKDSSQQPVPKTAPNSQFHRWFPTASSTDGSQQPVPQIVSNSQFHR